jgi:hypothetical protein
MTMAEAIGILTASAAIVGLILTMVMNTAKLGKMAGFLESGLSHQTAIITELKDEVVSLRKVTTDIAVFNVRMAGHDQQFSRMGNAIDDLRHGKGFITPFDKKDS